MGNEWGRGFGSERMRGRPDRSSCIVPESTRGAPGAAIHSPKKRSAQRWAKKMRVHGASEPAGGSRIGHPL